MIDVLGEKYYIDLDSIGKTINIESDVNLSGESDTTINIVSFDVIKIMLEIIMTEREELDENLGSYSMSKTSIPFRLAFNTLLRYNILKHF